MEKILEEILKETNSDRVVLYKIEQSDIFASKRSLFHLRPQIIISSDFAQQFTSDEELSKRSYPYYIFVDAIQTLFLEGSFSYLTRVDNRVSEACAIGLENICTEVGAKSLNYFVVDEHYIISIHHCRVPTLIKKSHINKYLSLLKRVL